MTKSWLQWTTFQWLQFFYNIYIDAFSGITGINVTYNFVQQVGLSVTSLNGSMSVLINAGLYGSKRVLKRYLHTVVQLCTVVFLTYKGLQPTWFSAVAQLWWRSKLGAKKSTIRKEKSSFSSRKSWSSSVWDLITLSNQCGKTSNTQKTIKK